MKILVNGHEAVLKAGSSFEYVSENPLFTDAEDYTMEIEFPMKDCPQNILIFGPLHVKGVDISKVTFPCQIFTTGFNKSGILTITEVSEAHVKGQFLEGMSAENFQTSADLLTYLTDLDFSGYDGTAETPSSIAEVEGTGWYDIDCYSENRGVVGAIEESPGVGTLRHRHVFLNRLVEIVCSLIGYSIDKSALLEIPFFSKVLVVNCIDGIIGNYGYYPLNRAMPKWTVKQFLQEVGNFFGCLTVINSNNKKISFVKYSEMMPTVGNERHIEVLDNFYSEIAEEDNEYIGNKGFKLPDECNKDNINMCPWFVDDRNYYLSRRETLTYANLRRHLENCCLSGIPADVRWFYDRQTHYIFQVTDKDNIYLIVTKHTEDMAEGAEEGDLPLKIFLEFDILNQYGDFRKGKELGIAPCNTRFIQKWGSATGHYMQAFKMPVIDMPIDGLIGFLNNDGEPVNDIVLDVLTGGEEKAENYFDKMWVVLVEDETDNFGNHIYTRKYEPEAGEVYLTEDAAKYEGEVPVWFAKIREHQHTLSPIAPDIQANLALPKVDESILYRFKFLSKSLPSATSIFVIKGKRYACLRLTAHFTPTGMSELIEGEFYEIVG